MLAGALGEGLGESGEAVLKEIRSLRLPVQRLVELAEDRRNLVDDSALADAVGQLIALVGQAREQAHAGRVSFGSHSARVMLGRAAALSTEPSVEATTLLEVAEDAAGPAQHMFEAR